MPGTTSAYAERVVGSYYLNITPDRDALARYGITIAAFFIGIIIIGTLQQRNITYRSAGNAFDGTVHAAGAE